MIRNVENTLKRVDWSNIERRRFVVILSLLPAATRAVHQQNLEEPTLYQTVVRPSLIEPLRLIESWANGGSDELATQALDLAQAVYDALPTPRPRVASDVALTVISLAKTCLLKDPACAALAAINTAKFSAATAGRGRGKYENVFTLAELGTTAASLLPVAATHSQMGE